MLAIQLRRSPLVCAFLAVSFAACHCGHGPRHSADELIDPNANVVVSAPDLGALADHVQALKEAARQGGNSTVEWVLSMADERAVGFDAFSRTGQKQVGLDPSGSLAFAGSSRSSGYVILPYTDLSMLTATIKRLGHDRLGADVEESRQVGQAKLTVLTRTAGGPAALAWVAKDSFLIVGVGEEAMASASAAFERKPENSAAKTGPIPTAKARIGARDVYVFLAHPPAILERFASASIGVGITASATDLSVRAYVASQSEQALNFARTLVGGSTPVAQLPADQPGYLRGGLDWGSIAATLAKTATAGDALQSFRAHFKEAGIDLDADLLANLQPGFAVSFGLAATANLSSALDINPLHQNPFENYTVIALGSVKDAAKAQAVLAKLPKALASLGGTVAVHDVAGSPVYTARYQLGEGLSWTLHGNQLIAAGGLSDRLDPIIEGIIKGVTPLKKDQFSPTVADVLFAEPGVALSLDFHRLTMSVDKLPLTAPGAFLIKNAVDGTLRSVEKLRPVLAIAPAEGGVMIDLVTNVK